MTTAPVIDSTELLAQGFAQHITAWVRSQQPTLDAAALATLATLEQAATQASLAVSNGHACALLSEVFESADSETLQAIARTLLASGAVGSPEAPGAMPLILDGASHLYLHRYFDYERRLARRLLDTRPPAAISAAARSQLQQLFAGNEAALAGRPDWQKIAAALALRQPFCVISGGPGTGKTTTMVNILGCLLSQDPGCRVALAAPTGKAAARMLEAIRARAEHLPETIRAALPEQSYTVHRLLGVTPTPGVYRHDRSNPLAIDLLVVDEASMLDLALAVKLFEAVPPGARIVLLGDKDQLAAVESGAVFAELCAAPGLSAACIEELAALTATPAELIRPPAAQASPVWQDSVVWFSENFRFQRDSGIGHLAGGISAGDPAPVMAWLRDQDGQEVGWQDEPTDRLSATSRQQILDGYQSYIEAVRQAAADPAAAFAAFGRFRILCAVRNSARGVLQVNEQVSQLLRPLLGAAGSQAPWYAGRAIIISHNDYGLRLFNGDIGLTLRDAQGELMVYFADAEGGYRALSPGRLPAHETAFAMTIHKAQGSEFERVLLLLPQQASRVVTRELFYTGVTRARARIDLAAPAAVIEQAIRTASKRHSGLRERMRELQR